MQGRATRLLTSVVVALGLAPGAAHVMEMPAKLGYTPEQYYLVTSTLYGYFGTVGAAVQVLGVILAAHLAWSSRGHPRLDFAVIGAVLLGLSLVMWGLMVAPVNAEWGAAMKFGTADLPRLYAQLRLRWEWGHVVAFGFWLLGYGCLQWFVVAGGKAPGANQ